MGVSRPVGRVLCLALLRGGGHPSRAAVADDLVRSTREHRAGSPQTLAQVPAKAGDPLDLAPGGVYRAIAVTCDAGGLLHHPFTLTLRPRPEGGLLSVALSRGSPRVGVTDHPALWSPDLPHWAMNPARPPGRLTLNKEYSRKRGSRPHAGRDPQRPWRKARGTRSNNPRAGSRCSAWPPAVLLPRPSPQRPPQRCGR
jgi:hypothetical protein